MRLEALQQNPCKQHVALDADVTTALQWLAKTTDEEVVAYREEATQRIEVAARNFIADGSCQRWLQVCSPSVRGVVATLNGPLLNMLIREAGHADVSLEQMMQQGSPLMGELECSHLGTPVELNGVRSEQSVREECLEHNRSLLKTLRPDEFAEELLAQTLKDAAANRMDSPVPSELMPAPVFCSFCLRMRCQSMSAQTLLA